MDARLTEEQRSLRDTVAKIVRKNAVSNVADLGDAKRAQRLHQDLTNTGLLELRHPEAGATGVEVALVTEALAAGSSEAAFIGPILAADLCRRAGSALPADCTVALTGDLSRIATDADLDSGAIAFDAAGARRALYLTASGDTFGLAFADVADTRRAVDLSRPIASLSVEPGDRRAQSLAGGLLTTDDLGAWRAFGHAVLSADLLGSARAAHLTTVSYAAERTQYGRSVASFQAVQHLLAESLVLLEGAESAVNYAAWAVDAESLDAAVEAALVTNLYCTSAARSICEIAIQLHGGIGNTWECMIHIHLRRALVAGQVLGDEGTLMEELVDRRLRAA